MKTKKIYHLNEDWTERELHCDETEYYLVLTCTAHGTPIYQIREDHNKDLDLPDRGVNNPPPVKFLGPVLVSARIKEKDLAEQVVYLLNISYDVSISLNDRCTWFENPGWIDNYLERGEYPVDG